MPKGQTDDSYVHFGTIQIVGLCVYLTSSIYSSLSSISYFFIMLSFLLISFHTGLIPDLPVYFFQNRTFPFPGRRS